jgi:hypothetical protein
VLLDGASVPSRPAALASALTRASVPGLAHLPLPPQGKTDFLNAYDQQLAALTQTAAEAREQDLGRRTLQASTQRGLEAAARGRHATGAYKPFEGGNTNMQERLRALGRGDQGEVA